MNRGRKSLAALRIRAELCSRFPEAFFPKGSPKKPLKVGIFEDIAAACPDLKRWQIALALRDYCRGPSYLAAVGLGLPRVDLCGSELVPVDPDHASHALDLLSDFPLEIRVRWLPDYVVSVA
jgi:ProP effector